MIVVTSAPLEYPVDLTELKDHMVIEHTTDDTLIEFHINSVVSYLDPPYGILGRAMVTQTLQYWIEKFPAGKILKLPFPPLQSVTTVKYYDSDEVLQTLPSALYTVVTQGEPGYIELDAGESWPVNLSERKYPIQINYIAGYGDNDESVPAGLKRWIMMSVSDAYMQREHIGQSGMSHNQFTMNMIENYRFRFGE
jgi:uncharacterized phiE125 gp8 family phage protein